jgi:hypothetical protein
MFKPHRLIHPFDITIYYNHFNHLTYLTTLTHPFNHIIKLFLITILLIPWGPSPFALTQPRRAPASRSQCGSARAHSWPPPERLPPRHPPTLASTLNTKKLGYGNYHVLYCFMVNLWWWWSWKFAKLQVLHALHFWETWLDLVSI